MWFHYYTNSIWRLQRTSMIDQWQSEVPVHSAGCGWACLMVNVWALDTWRVPCHGSVQWNTKFSRQFLSSFTFIGKTSEKIKILVLISIVKPTRCTNVSNLFYFGMTTFFGRSVQFHKCLLLYVQSWTTDDGRKECHSKIK